MNTLKPASQQSTARVEFAENSNTGAVELVRNNTLVEEFILVDGLGRSGKGMIGHILASMDRVEKVRLDLGYDTVHRLYRLGKLTHDAAVSMLSIEADMGLYNNYIGREVNFRFSAAGTGTNNNIPLLGNCRSNRFLLVFVQSKTIRTTTAQSLGEDYSGVSVNYPFIF